MNRLGLELRSFQQGKLKKLILLPAFIVLPGILLLSGCTSSAIPKPMGHLNDFANMISDNTENSLEAMLSQYESQTTNEVAVVTVETIGGRSIEEYTISLAEEWGVGKKDKDNGVIILVTKEEREVRIEVGYGLESVLTDAQAKLIIENEIIPRFRNEDYTGGIEAGVNAVIGTIEGSYSPGYTPSASPTAESGDAPPVWVILLLVFGFSSPVIIFFAVLGNRKRKKGSIWNSGSGWGSSWGSSSGRGSGGGFGGGSFGGGGASGRW